MHAGNFPQPCHNLLKVLKVGDVENNLHAGLAVRGMRPNISYITLSISNYTSNAFKHTKPVIAINRQLHRISRRRVLVAAPLHIDAAFPLQSTIGRGRALGRATWRE